MATALLDDELWRLVEPLLPVRKRRFHHPGRKRLDDRRTLRASLTSPVLSASLRALLRAIKPAPVRLTGASSAANTT